MYYIIVCKVLHARINCKTMWICRGAADGEGLGNSFLSHIAAVDGIFHVCRAFEDADVVHVEDRVDPVADLEIIHGCEALPACSLTIISSSSCEHESNSLAKSLVFPKFKGSCSRLPKRGS